MAKRITKNPAASTDRPCLWHRFPTGGSNSNRNYEVFWGETKEKRAFEDRHASTTAYIDYMRPRCVELARVLTKADSFDYYCDWRASHYIKVMGGNKCDPVCQAGARHSLV